MGVGDHSRLVVRRVCGDDEGGAFHDDGATCRHASTFAEAARRRSGCASDSARSGRILQLYMCGIGREISMRVTVEIDGWRSVYFPIPDNWSTNIRNVV